MIRCEFLLQALQLHLRLTQAHQVDLAAGQAPGEDSY
jgi:hypothetical protein